MLGEFESDSILPSLLRMEVVIACLVTFAKIGIATLIYRVKSWKFIVFFLVACYIEILFAKISLYLFIVCTMSANRLGN